LTDDPLMKYEYLIIGGGITADSAAKGIREIDSGGRIGLITKESNPPYDRPPLSKALWTGKKKINEIWRNTAEKGVDLHLSRSVMKIDPSNKIVFDERNEVYQYEKLLIATGGRPRKFPDAPPEIIYFRTVKDYKTLSNLAEENDTFGVIGGGFIGSEIASVLAMKELDVTIIFPGNGLCGRILPLELSKYLNSFYDEKGVKVLPGEKVVSLKKNTENIQVNTDRGKKLEFDVVVAGLGIIPNIELAKNAGLKVNDGIVVDEYLRTSSNDVFAAGDLARYRSPYLDKHVRVEHEDNANAMGIHAGRNMAGNMKPFEHLSFFYSDLFELGYEAVGELNSQLHTVVNWETKFRKGIVYYLENKVIRGVLLWNVWGQVETARELIAAKRSYNDKNLIGLI